MGSLDLSALYAIAAEYGINAEAYAHLNPGQKRMNIGNKLRRLVPESVYLGAATATLIDASPLVNSLRDKTVPAPVIANPVSMFDASTTNRELMQLYAKVIDELHVRNVVRTLNAPLGDYAEYLFVKALSWTLVNNSMAGHDAIDGAGLKFQIKARRMKSNSAGSRQLSVIRALADAKFDMLAGVLFDSRFDVVRAALIPYHIVVKRSSYVSHVNGWRLVLEEAIWDEPGVRDVTDALRRSE